MSNVDHYALEDRIKERVKGLSRDELRDLVVRLVEHGTVYTVREIAEILRVK